MGTCSLESRVVKHVSWKHVHWQTITLYAEDRWSPSPPAGVGDGRRPRSSRAARAGDAKV
ncbi:hypothetical protein FRACA_1600005 [Frankia canadensis]|uniref:Uncharacterized protein n=1 Tax=Frankia canadensis TaxID=1836972 RepID=A0A2I2KMM8_9ACTN|nr:hypothetical protein FRACA_1600005 [Frankia canadensis]SOU54203.1 hypothetical protein FRACA_1600005 [Frankia canadensis]